jgi:GH18 family chitinase
MHLLGNVFILALFSLSALAEKKLVVAYVPNWIDLRTFAQTIDYAKLTHINIAFENPNDAGELTFKDRNQFLIDKAREKGVKVLISIGGGAAAENKTLQARYFDLISADKRAAFAASIAQYVEKHQFDGLDVDIEGPSINKDYGDFIAELAKALKSKKKLLTAALSKGYGGDKVPDSVFEHFDFINIMAYDATGPWNPNKPGPHSSMEFARSSVNYWLERGVPKEKAVLGVPFYGHGFGDAAKRGGWSYKNIVATYQGAETRDESGKTVWYNGIPTIKAKTKYVVDEGLAGVMIWSLDGDASGEKSLLRAIDETLAPAR